MHMDGIKRIYMVLHDNELLRNINQTIVTQHFFQQFINFHLDPKPRDGQEFFSMSLIGSRSGKPADPYKEKNLDTETSVEGKVNGLIEFVTKCKFGMMTTRDSVSGMLVSRCMAIAGTENGIDLIFHTNTATGKSNELSSDPHVNVSFVKDSVSRIPASHFSVEANVGIRPASLSN
ncbi:hypothetical protein TWF481_005803 [Arthrobotrys musiformis]|uniref:General stress protein FMN-binding split barrel domain-containing protein n=1 Tax=Arthrobotrys musiformis TaxID=47236 RepID=A0AAV9WGI2_9PEZI